MHTARKGYLDCCPEVYTKIKGSLQKALEEAVKKELAIVLKKQKKNKSEETLFN